MTDKMALLYQYCPKVAILNSENQLLLARRQGEADLDSVFTLVGGKIEHSDASILDGVFRELAEEIGTDVELRILSSFTRAAEFTKADGNKMILPHYLADYLGGEIRLSDEYSDYKWFDMADLSSPGVLANISPITESLLTLRSIAVEADFVSFPG